MSRAAPKRKRPGESLNDSLNEDERKVWDIIVNKKDQGIPKRDIKFESKLADIVLNKCLKSLKLKNKLKEIRPVQGRGNILFMAMEFEPSVAITGGTFYNDGVLDTECIQSIKEACLQIIDYRKASTAEVIYDKVVSCGVVQGTPPSGKEIKDLLNSMVLDNELMEVKSTGLGDYRHIRVGALCYRRGSGKTVKLGAMASMPCGMCPVINQCTPDGVISPSKCVYFKKWSGLDF